jgi:TatA/E family protein of Tat protein translocase
MDFEGIDGWVIFLIIIIVLILFGPGKIVSVARTLGKVVHSLKKMTSDLTAIKPG